MFVDVTHNDNVGESGSISEDEDSIVRSAVHIGITGMSSVVLHVAHVLAARDGGRSRQDDLGTNTGWDAQGCGRDR